jgi:threonine dehydratase
MRSTPSVANILAASPRIDPLFLDSPIATDAALDADLGCELLAKDETRNPIQSFKGRGTEWFAATSLRADEAVVCASAGNFGQGLARATARRGHACTVFVGGDANPRKVDAMRRFGADVRVSGADFDAAKQAARAYAQTRGLRFVEDGAEAAVAEGAGTIGLELAAHAHFDIVFVPLGNGALLAGVGTALRRVAPGVRIVAVVAAHAPAMKLSLEAGRAVATNSAQTIADGIAVRMPIAEALPGLRRCCDEIVAVSEAHIVEAMRLLRRRLDLLVEPAGAVGVAAILAQRGRYSGRRVATILGGANIAPDLHKQLFPVDGGTGEPTLPPSARSVR